LHAYSAQIAGVFLEFELAQEILVLCQNQALATRCRLDVWSLANVLPLCFSIAEAKGYAIGIVTIVRPLTPCHLHSPAHVLATLDVNLWQFNMLMIPMQCTFQQNEKA
jgi:hypothetical protein